MASNPVFDKVFAMGALDDEWAMEETTDEHIIFKGSFGHAEVKADGRVVSQVTPYVAALEAAIRGEELPTKPAKGSTPAVRQGNHITSRSQAGNVPGSALETVQRTSNARDKTYRVGKQEEAYAAEKIKAFQEMGGSYEIKESEVSRDHARYLIRGTLPSGRFDESEYVVFRDQWMQDMAWDMVDKQMEKFGNMILNTDCPALENQMPNLMPGAVMKVRKNDDVSNKIYDVPAAYHIATTVNKLWKFQRIQAQTKCKAKIAKELAGALDMMESGEQEDEDREREQVSGGKA